MTENLRIAEYSLALLDDLAGTDVQAGLARFAAVEEWIDSSIARFSRQAGLRDEGAAAREVTVVAPLLNAGDPGQEIPAAPEVDAAAADHIVFSNSLSQRSSRQKLQNESLIKSLQELRARMSDTKLRSGKIITSQN